MSVHHGMQCPWRPEEYIQSPTTGIIESYELPCGCWEPNLVPLQEENMLLISEPSLGLKVFFFYFLSHICFILVLNFLNTKNDVLKFFLLLFLLISYSFLHKFFPIFCLFLSFYLIFFSIYTRSLTPSFVTFMYYFQTSSK